MSTDRDTTRVVRSWLEEGVTALPDRVLDSVLDQVPATPQRRSWWPAWRFAHMNAYAKLAIAAAAVVVVAVVGYNLLPSRGDTGGPLTSPLSPSLTPSASPAPAAMLKDAPHAACSPAGGAPDCLAAGTYRLTGSVWPGEITVSVPIGWFEWQPYTWEDAFDALLVDAGTNNGSGWGIQFIGVGMVAKDPCDPTKGKYAIAETGTVDGLVAAMSRWPGFQATAPAPTLVGGYSGQLVKLTSTRTGTDCPNASAWTIPQGGSVDGYPMVGATGKARAGTFRIVSVNGTLLVIRTTDFPETSPNELANGIPDDPTRHAADQVVMQQIVDSIRITKAPAQP
jgi:hypothetical protein